MLEPAARQTRRTDMTTSAARLTAVAAGLLLLLTGCGSAGGDAAGRAPEPAQVPTTVKGRPMGQAQPEGVSQVLYLTRERHPRGGWQQHLYVESGDEWPELTDPDGNPVVPFVATDTRPVTPLAVGCARGGFTVTVATPTRPAGVVFAWDVRRTAYQVRDGAATQGATTTLRTSVPDRALRAAMPELFDHRVLATCRVARQ